MNRKKIYIPPIIELIIIDRELVLQLASEPHPDFPEPEEGAGTGTNSFDKNNLNNNPFEK